MLQTMKMAKNASIIKSILYTGMILISILKFFNEIDVCNLIILVVFSKISLLTNI